jgi:hypothetical protein
LQQIFHQQVRTHPLHPTFAHRSFSVGELFFLWVSVYCRWAKAVKDHMDMRIGGWNGLLFLFMQEMQEKEGVDYFGSKKFYP